MSAVATFGKVCCRPTRLVCPRRANGSKVEGRTKILNHRWLTIAGDSSAAGTQGPYEDEAPSHAVLHDFCMMIPYGMIVILAGVYLAFQGPPMVGVLLSLSGVGMLASAKSSLQNWKRGGKGTWYTMTGALISTYLSWVWGIKVKMMAVQSELIGPVLLTLPAALMMLSLIMTIFLLYNVAAGGNPARKA